MGHTPSGARYDSMTHNRCGVSGLKLPGISLGLWQNFGGADDYDNARRMVLRAFDLGITHFDLANNYGPPPGSAEETFGRILHEDLAAHRDELVISTKAGYTMWPGPYGDFGSRKYLVASLDQSLARLGVEYVDVFYHHRPDPETPVDESMGALDHLVRAGKAIYPAISNYRADRTAAAAAALRRMGSPLVLHQPSYSMFRRWLEPDGLLDVLEREGAGAICFSTMAGGRLTEKYLDGVPDDSRAGRSHQPFTKDSISDDERARVRKLAGLARERGQTLAQMAVKWVLRDPRVTSALVGASKVEQIEETVAVLDQPGFTGEELARIDAILK